jgi:hypothetical protein
MDDAGTTAIGRSAAADNVFQALAIDIGGTDFKADVLDAKWRIVVEPLRVPTQYSLSRDVLLGRSP